MSSTRPHRFACSIGGYFATSCAVELVRGVLLYSVSQGGPILSPPQEVKPTEDQWREFRRALDALGIWDWSSDYTDPDILDGTQWALQIRYRDRYLKTEGCNAYPENFSMFRAELSRLLGGRGF